MKFVPHGDRAANCLIDADPKPIMEITMQKWLFAADAGRKRKKYSDGR